MDYDHNYDDFIKKFFSLKRLKSECYQKAKKLVDSKDDFMFCRECPYIMLHNTTLKILGLDSCLCRQVFCYYMHMSLEEARKKECYKKISRKAACDFFLEAFTSFLQNKKIGSTEIE